MNPKINPSTIAERTNQIYKLFDISIPSYENIKIEMVNSHVGNLDVNSMLYKSNCMLNLVFCMTQNDFFFNSNFTQI